MSRRGGMIAGVVVLVLVALLAVQAGGPGPVVGSVRSRGAAGWLAARRYLEARGQRVVLLAAPEQLDSPEAPGVLVLVFPWQHTPVAETVDFIDRVDRHLRRGGDVVLAYSGGVPGYIEQHITSLGWKPGRKPPLAPWRWRGFVREEWDLRPAAELAGSAAVRVWAPRYQPVPPAGAQILYRSPQGRPVAGMFHHNRGRVVFLPADALTNARLAGAGNADLLETLRQRLARTWIFDEFHHGLTLAAPPENAGLGVVFDLLLAHLALLYLLAVLALARRQGPAWREPPAHAGSAASFLLGMGQHHHRLGHHAEAARLLLARARELDRSLLLPAELDRMVEGADAPRLLAIARTVARLRQGRRSAASSSRRELHLFP